MMPAVANSRFKQLFVQIHSSLWFVPALLVLGMVLLAVGLVELDRHVDHVLQARWPRLFATEAEGARSMLSAIAGSMATIAGVAFSITMVALALASNQYTSRVLRNFMRDRANQLVLGIFIGVHVYCLFVLRAMGEQENALVPACAVLGALVLTVLACAAFIYFVHHISSTIQAEDMAEAITRETLQVIDDMFPDEARHDGATPACALPDAAAWQQVPAQKFGYVQTVDETRLVAFARDHDVVVRMACKPGDFVGIGEPIVWLAASSAPGASMVKALNRAYGFGAFRTIDQDPAFGIRQLVDISLKALSPAINDTTTAVTCLQHIGVILERCVRRHMAARHHYDGDTLRVLSASPDPVELVGLAFRQITENAEGNTEVLLRILGTIRKLGQACRTSSLRDALQEQVNIVGEIAMRTAKSHAAAAQLEASLQAVGALLASHAVHLHALPGHGHAAGSDAAHAAGQVRSVDLRPRSS